MMRKIYSISTLLLFVTLLLGCAGKPADTKLPEEKQNPSTTKVEPAQPSGETPLEGPLVIDPNKTPKKMTISGSLPQPTEAETANEINRLLEEHKAVQPGIKHPSARTPTNTKSITISNPATPSTTKSTSSQEDTYTVVQVFYGTDRQRTDGITSHPLGRVPWMLLAMGSGAVTLLAVILCCFWIRSKKAVLLTLILILITGGLGAAATLIPTNTKPEKARTDIAYSGDRGTLDMGICEVSIPKTHRLAELESPSILRFEISEDPTKHVVLLGIDPLEEEDFVKQLRSRVQESDDQEAFVFVHGYNVTFEDAARRTAQLAYDLNFQGAPILYSWPSQGGLFKYTVDENNVEWTVTHLKQFLQLVAKQSNAKKIHLIAHSMGNRALTRALEKLSYTDTKDGPIFNQVVLTAPDIDAEIFRRDLAPRIVKTAERVTLYASSNDEALVASKKVHGFPRAGESGIDVTVVPGIDTIDVSGLDTSLLGHSYYGSNDTVLNDMAQLLVESKPPTLRNRLQLKTLNGLKYWVFFVGNLRMSIEGRGETTR